MVTNLAQSYIFDLARPGHQAKLDVGFAHEQTTLMFGLATTNPALLHII